MTDTTADIPVVHSCCLKTFQWSGTPSGRVGTLASNQAYIADPPNPNPNPNTTSPKIAIILIHDLLGFTFPNARLLADHYANEVGATVYVPDFFGGESLPFEPILEERWGELDLAGFVGKNGRDVREKEIFSCARALKKELGYEKVGAIGFCYGGWAVFRLASQTVDEGEKEEEKKKKEKIVDCIVAAHPSMSTKEDVDGIDGVPTQMLAPEIDPAFTEELKMYFFRTMLKKGVPFDYQHFPSVVHGCLTRGDEKRDGEREALWTSDRSQDLATIVGRLSVESQAVEAADTISNMFFEDSALDGLLGLGFSHLNTIVPQSQLTCLIMLRISWMRSSVTYTFGAIEPGKYTGGIAYTPVDCTLGHWLFTADGYGTPQSLSPLDLPGIADTGTALLLILLLPDAVCIDYYQQVDGAAYDRLNAGFVFLCDPALPGSEFGAGYARARIPGEYMNFTSISNIWCCGGLQSNYGIGFSIYGAVATKAAYVVFDVEGKRLGWAAKDL
ncbi:hypothetical protein MKZ38_004903 [Zalerion maritima]|uniref:Peptidase A1 domain-containing protein n=1 Tax=Zalerion maritima TaxID=339359 RepID=A0AAD5WXA8_9PEZI|nr:hypothetical protein MKZ38_004903 [Zalerion maritima]